MKLAVIGAGLIGAAAARHLALQGHDITLIGPGEPADRSTHTGVFASHYDEGRITRSLDPHPFWSRASRNSIARYAEIEAQSGIRFYSGVGCLMAGPAGSPKVESMLSVQTRDAIPCEPYSGDTLRDRFPYFAFPEGSLALYEPLNAGHVSPRLLARAQLTAAIRAGAKLIPEEVTALREDSHGVTLTTESGTHSFDRVLLATGGFSKLLLGETLPMTVYARTVVLFRIEEAEIRRLAGMPSMIWMPVDEDNPYLLPPIRYPDGQTYLKMGADPDNTVLETRADLTDWFRSDGNPAAVDQVRPVLLRHMPGLDIAQTATLSCVTTYTPNELPHLVSLSPRIHTAIGGCGRAAKNSDELGRLGALLLTDQPLPDWAAVAAQASTTA
ncbi:NAD(P)/FAD-dependent oxidoreductase [Pseudooceanicola sp. C21-150M6]|uniref:NAD(P)/FAD-dependent oxidoreductase n=1 Tax=Pseudooceanicola sp. C21-150M6 TaxID=3434355 RepID=UPI003D7F3F49